MALYLCSFVKMSASLEWPGRFLILSMLAFYASQMATSRMLRCLSFLEMVDMGMGFVTSDMPRSFMRWKKVWQFCNPCPCSIIWPQRNFWKFWVPTGVPRQLGYPCQSQLDEGVSRPRICQ
jgi:hypothetical protein